MIGRLLFGTVTGFRSAASAILLIAATLFPISAGAQDKWQFLAVPYIWLPSTSSDVRINGIATGGDVSGSSTTDFSDVIRDLDFGFLGHLEAKKGRIALFSDITYLRITSDLGTKAFSAGPVSVSPLEIDLDLEAAVFELGGAYEFARWAVDGMVPGRFANAEVLAGMRGFFVTTDATLKTTFAGPLGLRSREVSGAIGASLELYDPIIGARVSLPLGSQWTGTFRGDIGGFGAGSEFTWSVVVSARYQHWDNAGFVFGYKALGYKIEFDEPGTSTELDLTLHGPAVAVFFTF